jgi:hypothetical protein
MTAYSTIQPPFTLKFRQMSRKELRAYFQWFQEITPERIEQLACIVRSSPGFENWQADYSAQSLNALGDWFATQIETRPRTQEEIDTFNAQAPFPIEISNRELTNRTFSLAMDIAMYLNQVFLRNNPELKWNQPFGGKTDSNFGQPVLVGFQGGDLPLNSVHVLVTLAYSLQSKDRSGGRLREIYDVHAQERQEPFEGHVNPKFQSNAGRPSETGYLSDLIARMTVKESYAHSDDSISWQAHREAETLADAWMVDELAAYLPKERDQDRRRAAHFILGKLGLKIRNSDCASILLSRVGQEQNKYVLSDLLDLLSKLHKPGHLDLAPMYRLLRDDRWQVRHSAISALSRTDSPEAEDQLIELLNISTKQDDILACLGMLGGIGSTKSIPHLEKNLTSKKTSVKSTARAAVKAIEWRAKNDGSQKPRPLPR